MKLLHSPMSPFVRMVMTALHETGQIAAVEIVDGATTPMATVAAVRAANPLGKIPALLLDSGEALHDSRVIARYLGARPGGERLYPEGEALWPVLVLESTAHGVAEAALAIVYEDRMRDEAARSQAWKDAQGQKIDAALAAIDAAAGSRLAGDFNMGQIALACALGYLDFRLKTPWRKANPALAAWFETVAARPSMIATAPPG